MSILLQTRPERVSTGYVNGVLQNTLKSRWIASRNPVVYRMLRVDHSYTAIQNNAGQQRLIIPGADITSYYTPGDKIIQWQNSNILSPNVNNSVIPTVVSSVYNGGLVQNEITISYAYAVNGSGHIVNQNKRTDWKMQVEIFEGASSVSLTEGLVKFDFYPDQYGRVVVDISEVIKQFPRAEYQNLTTASEIETNASLAFWIKYQEYYDGALQGAVINDNNIHYAAHAAQQVYYRQARQSNGSNLIDYVMGDSTKKFLRRFDALKMWRGYPFTLSFIWPIVTGPLPALSLLYYETDINKTVQPWTAIALATPSVVIDRLKHVRLGNLVTQLTTKYLVAKLGISASAGAGGSAVGATGTVTLDLNLGSMLPAGNYTVLSGSLSVQRTSGIPLGPITDLTQQVRNSSTLGMAGIPPTSLATNGTNLLSSNHNGTAFTSIIPFDQVRLTFSCNTADTFDWSYTTFVILGPDKSETVEIKVMEPDANQVMLFWKNSLGGDSWWMFERNAEKRKQLGAKKATRLNLFADGVTEAEWEALDELNTTKENYGNPITELSTAVMQTSTQVDQQACIVDTAGEGTGVVVIPKSARTETIRTKNDIQIEIELPSVL